MATTITPMTPTTPEVKPKAAPISLTTSAITKVKEIMAQQNPVPAGLRVGVQGGGCSGMSYVLRFETESDEQDHIFEFGEVRVFIDPKSFIYLRGMVLDWEDTLMRQGFLFNNPNATKSCGCGTSFS